MDTQADKLAVTLRSQGYRNSKLKIAIFDALQKADTPLDIKQIITICSKKAHFASVYRSVDILLKAKVIKLVPTGHKNKYELSDEFSPHHHHASCKNCDKVSLISSASLENILESLAEQSGLQSSQHHLELIGLCRNCFKATKQD